VSGSVWNGIREGGDLLDQKQGLGMVMVLDHDEIDLLVQAEHVLIAAG